MKSQRILYLFLIITYSGVNAALIERDWLSPNDALLTYDTKTGLEWLDVPATSDMSYNDVALELINNASYQGFSYATEQQVTTFFNSGNLQDTYNATDAPEEIIKIEQFLNFWGVCWYIGTGQRTEFITSNTANLAAGKHWSGRLVWFPPGTAAYTAHGGEGVDDNNSGFTFGSALVRNALPVAIDGDINEDGTFDTGDLTLMIALILNTPVNKNIEPGHGDFYPPGNPDGIINMADFILMIKSIY